MEIRTEENIKKLISILQDRNEMLSTMESCTGGLLASEITNNKSGSSEVFRYGLVTYANEFKIKNGVKAETIDKYSVYSQEVAEEMANQIIDIADSDWGIGITGQIGRLDPENPGAEANTAYYCIANKKLNISNKYKMHCDENLTKKEKKEAIVSEVIKSLLDILENK